MSLAAIYNDLKFSLPCVQPTRRSLEAAPEVAPRFDSVSYPEMSARTSFRVIVAIALLVTGAALFAQPTAVAEKRAQHLQHGINASEWFAQSKDYSPQRLHAYTTLDDLAAIRQMGFDHVRLSIDPEIFNCSTPWTQCERVQVLDQVIAKALAEGLAVVIDLHPSGEYKQGIAASDNAVEQFMILWGRIAAYYAKSDPERVFFEVMNEPELEDPFRWAGIEQRAVAEIRRNAPQHTLLVAGANYSDIADLFGCRSLPTAT